jgi:hypothetical protein
MQRVVRWLAIGILAGAATGVADGIEYRSYHSTRLGVSVSIPSEWEVTEAKDGSLTVTGSTGVLVLSARPRGTATVETLREHALAYVKSGNVRIRNSGRKTIQEVPGWLFQYVTGDADDPLAGDTLCLLHENWMIAVAFATRQWLYGASRPVFETAIQSLKLGTPEGMRPLNRGFRRYDDSKKTFRLQVPEAWQLTSTANQQPFFAGPDGTLQVIVESGSRYLPGDAEILARAYVERAGYRLQKVTPGQIDGQPAQFAYCEAIDRSGWEGCFVVSVREGRLYVLKIAVQGREAGDRVTEIVGSFQFLPLRAVKDEGRGTKIP